MLSRLTVRSVIVIILVVGAFVLAVVDDNFRPTFGDLALGRRRGVLGANATRGKQTLYWGFMLVKLFL